MLKLHVRSRRALQEVWVCPDDDIIRGGDQVLGTFEAGDTDAGQLLGDDRLKGLVATTVAALIRGPDADVAGLPPEIAQLLPQLRRIARDARVGPPA